MKSSIEIKQIGITELDTDAIVNAANHLLERGGGVCGAIFAEAGTDELRHACNRIGHCRTGEAVITPGFNLKAKYIIHAVGPVWHGGDDNEEELLYSAYENSLKLARKHDCHSIAFPVISSGIYGYPKREAWKVAVSACNDFIKNNPDYPIRIIFAVLSNESRMMGESAILGISNTYDFKKLEENLHRFLKPKNDRTSTALDEIRITEKLFERKERAYIPFGYMDYFLVIEDNRPIIYAHALSRMDLDSICFIDEKGWKCYDVYDGDHDDIWKKYRNKARRVRESREMKGIPKRM